MTTTEVHWDEVHELTPTGSLNIGALLHTQKCAPQNHPCYIHRVTVSNQSDYNDFENQISHNGNWRHSL